MQDQEILSGLQRRDEQAIALAMAKYARLLWPVASAVLKNVGSDQDVEECIADVFIELWQNPCRFDPRRGRPMLCRMPLASSPVPQTARNSSASIYSCPGRKGKKAIAGRYPCCSTEFMR